MQLGLIDIGSRGGLENPWRRAPGLIGKVLAFEPNDELRDGGNRLSYPTAVWNYDGEADFTVYGEHGFGSSLLPQNVEWVRENFARIGNQGNHRLAATWFDRAQPKGSFTCPVRKLDTILADIPTRPRFHFLKSDTQSGEWFVIDGARDFLANECLGVELECFRYPLYEGLRTEDEVFALMDELGFDRWGWTGYQNTFLSQADYLFLKRNPAAADRVAVGAIKALYRTEGPDSLIKRASIAERALYKVRSKLAA
jgi:FkbM family methyltransferase